ncbi:MAG: 23S rRNA (uracil(1939)-C(5))-methyltransferase RlmD [Oscillospiraceae bacterium]|nr:23S rRNA (uracil(1939)-C(5))-methyltransferase RlmD [Oscillospiraceae bacterium]
MENIIELKKNQIYETDIVSWSSDGSGVCRIDGRAVFVPGAIPGERWEVRILKLTKTAVFGKGEKLLSPAPCRTEPDCPYFKKCGGCALRHISYEAELDFKLERVNEAFKRIGGLDLEAGEIIGGEDTERYRNKGIYAIGDGPIKGFFRPRSHDIIPVGDCIIQNNASNAAAQAVCDFMAANNISAYDEHSGKGLVRHVFTRYGRSSKELQVTVIAAGGFGGKTSALAEAIRKACPECVSIVLNVNRSKGNTVLAGDFYTLWGKDTISDTLCGLDFQLSPRSFYQINPLQAEKLYYKALEYASPDGKGLILDLYCGAGTISLCLARGCEKVIGAEIVPEAVENAKQNAERNDIKNAEFICGDAGEAAAELLRRGTKPDAVVVDPPRKGLSPEVIDAICGMKPERVVYVSCDVSTQARDLKIFAEKGYLAEKATAVDMFPRTHHVETVVCLKRLTNR